MAIKPLAELTSISTSSPSTPCNAAENTFASIQGNRMRPSTPWTLLENRFYSETHPQMPQI
jgi:hypothetical protein